MLMLLLAVLLHHGPRQQPQQPAPAPYPTACGTEACGNPWNCWTVSITYRENIAPEMAAPEYRTRRIEFLHEPGNVWAYREDAECHARQAVREGIMGPLNFPDNTERVMIPPSAIEGVRVWMIPMPN